MAERTNHNLIRRLWTSVNVLKTQVASAGIGGAVWGAITGTLGAQADLTAALADKADLGEDGKVLPDQLPEGQGGAAWGGITGTLSAQTDLNSALAGKETAGAAAAAVSSHTSTHNHALLHAATNDPSAGEKSALAGTSGTPGDTNRFVTDDDSRMENQREPTTHGNLRHDPAFLTMDAALGIKLDDLTAPDDTTDLNSSPDRHGLLPKLGGGTTNFLRADGTWAAPGGGGADPWTVVKLASDFTTSNATNTNVTGLLFTPAANKTYVVYGGFLLRTATATVGARPGIAWPTVSDGGAWIDVPNSLTAAAMRIWGARNTQNAASTGLADTASSHYAKLEALIVSGASPSGNFQITLASETAGTNVTIKAGSYIAYREI